MTRPLRVTIQVRGTLTVDLARVPEGATADEILEAAKAAYDDGVTSQRLDLQLPDDTIGMTVRSGEMSYD